jgi:hypothetical protein
MGSLEAEDKVKREETEGLIYVVMPVRDMIFGICVFMGLEVFGMLLASSPFEAFVVASLMIILFRALTVPIEVLNNLVEIREQGVRNDEGSQSLAASQSNSDLKQRARLTRFMFDFSLTVFLAITGYGYTLYLYLNS